MKSKANLFLIFFAAISFLFFIYNNNSLSSGFTSSVQDIFSSPMNVLYNLKTNILGVSLNTNEELEKLKAENKKLVEKTADYEKLENDNKAYRDQFENGGLETKKLLPAKVIGFLGAYESPHTLIIDKGSRNNIKQGAVAIYEKNLVGVVKKVSQSFSTVVLPVNEDFSVIGKSGNGTSGILKGGDDFIVFDKVAITDNLNKDDLVVTKGEVDINGIGVLPDIIVGKIISINKSENMPFQNAKVQSLLDFAKLQTVFVVISL